MPSPAASQGRISRQKPFKTLTPTRTKNHTTVAISEPDGYINGHGYVDLGLPSGIKWSTCNIGAYLPSDYGNYYAWGETQPKSIYTETNSKTLGRNLTNISGNSAFDTATANWGTNWIMPSKEEMQELIEHCIWVEGAKLNGHRGMQVIGPNGKSIFLPNTGHRDNALKSRQTDGEYWSSTSEMKNNTIAYYIRFYHSDDGTWSPTSDNTSERYYGRAIRPIVTSVDRSPLGRIAKDLSTTMRHSEIHLSHTNNKTSITFCYSSDVLFSIGALMSTVARIELAAMEVALKDNSNLKLDIICYTDNQGSYSDASLLVNNRAEVLSSYFCRNNLSSTVTAKGIPQRDYIATNDTPEGRAQNRRVEFILSMGQ